jgi:membrane dipeptidase
LIVDAHNDLLLELELRGGEENPFGRHWLPRLREGGVVLQVCPIFTSDRVEGTHRAAGLELLAAWERALEENSDSVFPVLTASDLDRVGRDGRIGLLLSLEGVEPVTDGFDEWWDAGVRMAGLTWNRPTWAAGGLDTPGDGLTDAGRALVDELVERGVVLDLAHASPPTCDELLASGGHVICSHACCRAVEDVERNLSDDQLRALAARGGVLGLMTLALVVGYDRPTIDGLLDHLDHAVSVMGIEHVGLGADVIDQVTAAELEAGRSLEPVVEEARVRGGGRLGLDDFTGPEHYPAFVDALGRRGYDDAAVAAVTHGNFLRVLRAALPERV